MAYPRFHAHIPDLDIEFDAHDFTLSPEALIEKYPRDGKDPEDGHPIFPYSDWAYDVANGDTRRSYGEWLASNLESAFYDIDPTIRAQIRAMAPAPDYVAGEIHTDDYHDEHTFNAVPWLAQASVNDLIDLANEGWCNSQAADGVAYYMENIDPRVAEVLGATRPETMTRDAIGFGLSIEPAEAMNWLKHNRPGEWACLVCEENGVSLEQRQDATRSGWVWINDQSIESGTLLADRNEAALNAIAVMGLVPASALDDALAARSRPAPEAAMPAPALPKPTLVEPYDSTDAAYLFKGFSALYSQHRDLAFGGELECMSAMFEHSIRGAQAIQSMIDFGEGYEDGPFAYEELEATTPDSLTGRLYDTMLQTQDAEAAVVLYATQQGWQLTEAGMEKAQTMGVALEPVDEAPAPF